MNSSGAAYLVAVAGVVVATSCAGGSEPDSTPTSVTAVTAVTEAGSGSDPDVPTSSEEPAPDVVSTGSTGATDPAPPDEVSPVVLPSVAFPEINSVTQRQLADQSRRSALDGADTFYWPDGNIGALDLIDGTTRFFAANGSRIAQTLGTPLDPTGELIVASQEIVGVSDEFDYAAGGPVYLDTASGVLLLWYHAERHLDGDPANFHAAVGLARSDDLGTTFTDLGIIIETNTAPDPAQRCCADVGGAPVIVRDGMFHLYFRDRVGAAGQRDIQLARASALVDDVVAAALEGELAPWTKFDVSGDTPGLGGTSSALEAGNPPTSWFDVAWHEGMQRYLMAIAVHGAPADPSTLYLTSSQDGLVWTPRQVLVECQCELTYPSFLGTVGPERVVGNQLDIAYVETASSAEFRWQETTLDTAIVMLSGDLVTAPSTWAFDEGDEGWKPGGDALTTTPGGALVVAAAGPDPYVSVSGLGLSADEFATLRITMTSDVTGVGQVFFTTGDRPTIDEGRSVRFEVTASDDDVVYEVDLASVEGWTGLIDTLRIDPVDAAGTVTIDTIRLEERAD